MRTAARFRTALGGAVCGTMLGIAAGALCGIVYGLFAGNVCLGLDGALWGGAVLACVGAVAGAIAGPPEGDESFGYPEQVEDSQQASKAETPAR